MIRRARIDQKGVYLVIAVDLREVVLVIASEEVILETVQDLTEAVLLRVVISQPGKLREESDLFLLHVQG